mgnify:CR=1 FL=1|tara:strand:+ start:9823 stop:10452 length:630 start_codon:yes stop_codon:yes gene_type:complete
MSVKLIAASVPQIPECNTLKQLVAYCAKVSNPSNQANHETADKLFDYLKKHSHWSPFEMVSMTIEIKTTRDIARQILRHRSFSFQEFSQRYAEVEAPFEFKEARTQDLKNRQNSVVSEDEKFKLEWHRCQSRVMWMAEQEYKNALDMGIAKEQARALLPEGLTQSTLYMAGTLRSWLHYCDLRCANGTQKEHMLIAEKCKDIITKLLEE